nr:hypothetical protein [Thermoleophilaceae bacterium]
GKDAWFVGYTPKLSTSVWVGYPDAGIAMPGAQGGTLAAPVWKAFMAPAQESDCSDFPEPETAFEPSSFDSEYSSGGSSSDYSGDDDTYYPPDDDTYYPPAEDTTGDAPYNPEAYEAPPQDELAPAPTPPPVPINPPAGGGEAAPPGQ